MRLTAIETSTGRNSSRVRGVSATLMKRITLVLGLAQWVLVIGLFGVGMLLWPSTPEAVPVHWNLAGQVDRYRGKFEGLFMVPIIALVLLVLFELLPRLDPHRARYAEFWTAYTVIRFAVFAVLAGVYGVILLWTQGVQVSVGPVIGTLIGTLFIVMGLVIDQVRPNWFVGIRTPWTPCSDWLFIPTSSGARMPQPYDRRQWIGCRLWSAARCGS
jgi:uncharacterized membrane protein